MVENNHEHGCAAEEDGQRVEGVVGDHCEGCKAVLRVGSVMSSNGLVGDLTDSSKIKKTVDIFVRVLVERRGCVCS